VLLNWDSEGVYVLAVLCSRSTFYVMSVTGWSRGLEVSGGGQGVASHGLALLWHLADKTGLTGGLASGQIQMAASARIRRKIEQLENSGMLTWSCRSVLIESGR